MACRPSLPHLSLSQFLSPLCFPLLLFLLLLPLELIIQCTHASATALPSILPLHSRHPAHSHPFLLQRDLSRLAFLAKRATSRKHPFPASCSSSHSSSLARRLNLLSSKRVPHSESVDVTEKGSRGSSAESHSYSVFSQNGLATGGTSALKRIQLPTPAPPPPPPVPTKSISLQDYNSLDGPYYIRINVGYPRRPFLFTIDTGSDMSWLLCDAPTCSSCPGSPTQPPYSPNLNRTAASVQCRSKACDPVPKAFWTDCSDTPECQFSLSYIESSTVEGVAIYDVMSFYLLPGRTVRLPVLFGCATSFLGPLRSQPADTDGLFGLSRSPVSLPSQFAEFTGFRMDKTFGYCIGQGSSPGFIFFGNGLDPNMAWNRKKVNGSVVSALGDWHWTNLATSIYDTSLYYLNLTNIIVAGKQIPTPQGGFPQYDPLTGTGGTQFDTGTVFTFLHPAVYASFLPAFLAKVQEKYIVRTKPRFGFKCCWKPRQAATVLTDLSQVHGLFPNTYFQFGGNSVFLRATYLEYLALVRGSVCLGILSNKYLASTIIGARMMQSSIFIHDNVKNRIGWRMSYNCSSSTKIN